MDTTQTTRGKREEDHLGSAGCLLVYGIHLSRHSDVAKIDSNNWSTCSEAKKKQRKEKKGKFVRVYDTFHTASQGEVYGRLDGHDNTRKGDSRSSGLVKPWWDGDDMNRMGRRRGVKQDIIAMPRGLRKISTLFVSTNAK